MTRKEENCQKSISIENSINKGRRDLKSYQILQLPMSDSPVSARISRTAGKHMSEEKSD